MKKFNLAVAFAAVATMAVASSASAGVERYQMESWTITALQRDNVDPLGFTHLFDVVRNPCDGSFEGDGWVVGNSIGWSGTATIKGFVDENSVTFTAKYDVGGIEYGLNDAPLGTEKQAISVYPLPIMLTVEADRGVDLTNYKNHGEYVTAQGGGADAAHSCIGRPKPKR